MDSKSLACVRKMWANLRHQIGRRGATLLFFGFLDLVFAFSLFKPLAETQRNAGIIYVASIAPLWFWGILWLIAGVCCLVGAFMRQDQGSFMAAVVIKMLWGGIYALAGIFANLQRAWLSATIWLCLGVFILIISTWPEPPRDKP